MAKTLRWAGYGLAAILLILVVLAVLVWGISASKLNAHPDARAERLIPAAQADLKLGQYLLVARACAECHGEGVGGAKFLDVPKVATLYAPNLPLLAKTATDQQLAQAIRQGIGHDGRPLLVMPSESYSAFTDAETAALIKAIRALPPRGSQTPAARIGPLGRVAIVVGKLNTAPVLVDKYANAQPADLGPEFVAGRHIAMTVCSGCHGSTLAGSEPEPGTKAPNLDIAGAYDAAAFTRLMRTGLPPSGRELKMMTGVSRKAFSHMTDAEIGQLYGYLQERAKRAR
jgi:cytochrome c553